MTVLVLGGGGREHALAWRFRQDPDVAAVVAAPGNPGTLAVGRNAPVDLSSNADIVALASRERADLVVVGPEAPLERGAADALRAAGVPTLGPVAAAARLECSKAWAKDFMARHGIPTARFGVFSDPEAALEALAAGRFGIPVVVKADGLAAGKGVTVADSPAHAEAAVREAMVERRFGAAGARLVLEECLTGPELSLFYLADGRRAVYLGSAQDHKRQLDGDRGPNTGGMGAFAPSPLATSALEEDIRRRVVDPVLSGLQAAGHPYIGFLYVSLMLTEAGPTVIEFNVRFGDPEAQVLMPLLEGRLARVCLAAATGRLSDADVRIGSGRTVGVVLAAQGYPAAVQTGQPISGLEDAASVPGVTVFHAGTSVADGRVVTAGGRVLTVVAHRASFEDAIEAAYAAVARIRFAGMQYRTDIGRRALHPNRLK